MFSITIQFLQGRYHATPWGKHVNEGIPEWPPTPWRILRAIIAAWKNTHPDLQEEIIWPILQKLTIAPPRYYLPDASVSHTRHYVPTNKKPLIMDTFVIMGKKPVYVVWNDVNFSPKEIEQLSNILKNIHYLGRAESWCKVSVSSSNPESNCTPLEDENVSDAQKKEIVRVLVPNTSACLEHLNKQRKNIDILKSITVTTKDLQDNNYADPPAAKWVTYTRPRNCFEHKSVTSNYALLDDVNLVRYAVVGNVRPDIRDTLRVADMTRTACMSKYGKIKDGEPSATFSGKDSLGKPLTDHMHAFFLPTYETSQSTKIDYITIITKKGFNRSELDSMLRLKYLYRYNTDRINLLFQGCGSMNNFSDIPILGTSRTWVSVTPLVLTRHVKYRGKGNKKRVVDSPEEQIQNEVHQRYGNEYDIEKIVLDDQKIGKTNFRPSEFFRWRNRGSMGNDHAYNVQLFFKKPLRGPLTIGYASHFGLGMFAPRGDIK